MTPSHAASKITNLNVLTDDTQVAPLALAIQQTRSAVAAVMRIIPKPPPPDPKQPPQFAIAMVGTAWCVAHGIHFVTANHILNGSKPRDIAGKFFLFLVPDNGTRAYRFPVVDFPLEDNKSDLAILTIDPGDSPPARAATLPVTFDDLNDGTQVVTCGFPSPIIVKGNVDVHGNWIGGQFFLKSHANTGIVSAQYVLRDAPPIYELNVGWHHGESGGPICRAQPVAAFSVMQGYRNIQSPHGVVAGPHRGVSLRVIQPELEQLGAHIV